MEPVVDPGDPGLLAEIGTGLMSIPVKGSLVTGTI